MYCSYGGVVCGVAAHAAKNSSWTIAPCESLRRQYETGCTHFSQEFRWVGVILTMFVLKVIAGH